MHQTVVFANAIRVMLENRASSCLFRQQQPVTLVSGEGKHARWPLGGKENP
jgi:hypothetical protein